MRLTFAVMILAMSLTAPAHAQGVREFHRAIGQRLNSSESVNAELAKLSGCKRLVIAFELSKSGSVSNVRVANRTFSPALNTAVIGAFRKLPRFRNMPAWAAGSTYRMPVNLCNRPQDKSPVLRHR